MVRLPHEFAACVASVLLLAGAAADRLSLLPPSDAAAYHARVRDAADKVLGAEEAKVPVGFDEYLSATEVVHWRGQGMTVPVEATNQLHPNVMISRAYTGHACSAGFLLVQCGDVRDLVPHYPPVCYPGRGLSLVASVPRDWQVGKMTVQGTEYHFESSTLQTNKLVIVDDFMVLPDGRFCRDMQEVRRQVGLRTRYFGAAQVQVVFNSDVPEQQRQEACRTILAHYEPLLQAIREGVKHGQG